MKPLSGGQIFLLIIIGLVTVFYLGSRNRNNDRDDETSSDYAILIEESFEFDDQTIIDLELSSDNIYVTTSNTDIISITYENQAFSKGEHDDLIDRIHIENNSDRIRVYIDDKRHLDFNFMDRIFYFIDNGFNNISMGGRLDVVIPDNYQEELIVATSSGHIDISDFKRLNNLSVATSSGGIEIDRVEVDDILKCSTSSGRIIIDTSYGDNVDLSTSSGRIEYNGNADNCNIETSSGSISYETDSLYGEYNFDSSSGSIHLNVPNEPFRFESDRSSGSFSTNMDLEFTKEKDDSDKGYYLDKNADAFINISSSSGSHKLNASIY